MVQQIQNKAGTSDAFGSTSVTGLKKMLLAGEWPKTSPEHVYSDVNKQLIQEETRGPQARMPSRKSCFKIWNSSNLPMLFIFVLFLIVSIY